MNEQSTNMAGTCHQPMSPRHCFCLACPSWRGKLEQTFKTTGLKQWLIMAKMRCWKQRNEGITAGPTFRHGFPAEDGAKPGLEGWESSEKPEKTLGKVFTRGDNRVNIGGISLGWKCLGSGVKKRSKRQQGTPRVSRLPYLVSLTQYSSLAGREEAGDERSRAPPFRLREKYLRETPSRQLRFLLRLPGSVIYQNASVRLFSDFHMK